MTDIPMGAYESWPLLAVLGCWHDHLAHSWANG